MYSGCSTSALTIGNVYQVNLLLNPGSINSNFQTGLGFNNFAIGLGVQNDGKVLVSGNFSQYNNQGVSSEIVRLNIDGSLDNTFSYGGPNYVYIDDVEVLSSGKILIGLGQLDNCIR